MVNTNYRKHLTPIIERSNFSTSWISVWDKL